MTLREAVEHIQLCPNGYGQDGCGVCCDRARAIVDAAVEAHEARCEADDLVTPAHAAMKRMAANDAKRITHNKLRALERGEDAP